MDFARVDAQLYDDIELVLRELVETGGLSPECMMLVGAQCRDILHQALGHTEPNTATGDLDFGVALTDWESFERIDDAFTREGDTGIRYRIAGVLVDVMPFGVSIEDPSGITTPRSRGDALVVFGFDDVFANALWIDIPGAGYRIRIPTPAGYAALKLRAWVDRAAYGEFKDARDLDTVLRWYGAPNALDRIYDEDGVMARYGFDVNLAAAHLLGRDAGRVLSSTNAEDLAERFARSDLRIFASKLSGETWDLRRQEERVRALLGGLRDRV